MPKRKGATQDANRAAMAEACVALAAERGWAHATVAAITERANVNRSTFHRNFASREDAVRLWYRQLVEGRLARPGQAGAAPTKAMTSDAKAGSPSGKPAASSFGTRDCTEP